MIRPSTPAHKTRLPWRRGTALLLGTMALGVLAGSSVAARVAAGNDVAVQPVVLTAQMNPGRLNPGRPDVVLDATVFVERTHLAATGPFHTLEPARQLSRGDRVVTLLTWYRLGGKDGFVVTNALPATLTYQDDAGEEVSVDGGRNWGHLGGLRLHRRIATAQDVTHVRWHVSPAQAMAGSGRIAYAGLVK